MNGEHVPGHDADEGVVCPVCECPDCKIVALREGMHSVWDRNRRKMIRLQITRRKRSCQNHNCNAVFWTTERLELNDGD